MNEFHSVTILFSDPNNYGFDRNIIASSRFNYQDKLKSLLFSWDRVIYLLIKFFKKPKNLRLETYILKFVSDVLYSGLLCPKNLLTDVSRV